MRKWTLLFVFTSLLAASCGSIGNRESVNGNGQVPSENRNPGNFTGVSTLGNLNLYVAIGSTPSVKIEAENNILPYIETYVENGSLMVKAKNNVNLVTDKPIKVYITAPQLSKILSQGMGDVVGQTAITDPSKLEIELQGDGNINLDVDAPEVKAVVTGIGNIQLKGQSKNVECKVVGEGNIKAIDLQAEEAKVSILGDGDVDVSTSVKLDVNITGNGNVKYKGNVTPSKSVTGSGNITQVQ
ncbi:MAG TPA: head GIN domain-containing protein [Niastella sp.]